jgi:hypothetical protein
VNVKRAAASFAIACVVAAILLSIPYLALVYALQHSPKLRETVAMWSYIGFLPALPFMALAVALASYLGYLAARGMFPRLSPPSGTAVKTTGVASTDAIAAAVAQHMKGVETKAVCPECNMTITVTRTVAPGSSGEAKLHVSCACGACSGVFPD